MKEIPELADKIRGAGGVKVCYGSDERVLSPMQQAWIADALVAYEKARTTRPEERRSLCGSSVCKTKCDMPEDCMQQSEPTPLTDELCRDHYYEASAESAGMIVSAKSPEECYREAIGHARQLERKARVMQRELEKQTIPSPLARRPEEKP